MTSDKSGTNTPVVQGTPDDQDTDFLATLGAGSMAYIRPVKAGDIAESVPEARQLPPATMLYALYGAAGEPILLTTTRELAVAGAQEHELTPVSLH